MTKNEKTFKCRLCDGKGEARNPYFEACPEDISKGDCNNCCYDSKTQCKAGEIIECGHCNGEGILRLDMNQWEEV